MFCKTWKQNYVLNLIIRYYELATDEHLDDVENIKRELSSGTNPRDIKLKLANIITGLYHPASEVEKVVRYYDLAFSKKSIPDNIPAMVIEEDKIKVNDIIPKLISIGLIKSRSEFIRLVKQGGAN